MTPIPDQILTQLSLHGRMLPRVLSDVVASHPGCEDQLAVNAEIVRLIDAGLIEVDGAYLCHVEPERTEEEDLAAYFRAADTYRAQMARRRGFWSWVGVKITIAWEKFLAAWDRIWPGIVLIIATSGFALGLCAQDVPRWVLVGIAQVETGTEYRDMGDVRGTWQRGAIGECGPWQLAPSVLRDLHAYGRRHRVHADVVFAESLTRAWLLRLYGVTGNWSQAVAAYHSGLGRRTESFAINYADRVRAAGSN